MPTIKLTDAAVQKFKAKPGTRIEYFDATLPGFGLRVAGPTARTPSGRKSWVLMYRLRGEQKRLTLGLYLDRDQASEQTEDTDEVKGADGPRLPLSLADARERARDALHMVAKGFDPAEKRATAQAEAARPRDTFGTAVEKFLASGMKGKKGKPLAARYIEETKRNFDNHVLPRWKDRTLEGITRRDVIHLLDAIAAYEAPEGRQPKTKQERPPGGPIAANRVLAAVRAMLNWALRRGMIEVNPCALVERPGEETRRERTLTAAEIQELWAAFTSQGHPFGPYFQIALLTGQRRTEVARMKWASLDLAAGTWTLDAAETKNGQPHVVPLSAAAIAIIKAIPRKTKTLPDKKQVPSPWVFTSDGGAPISGFSSAKDQVDAKVAKARRDAEITEDMPSWGIHDLRRTAATEMGRLGTPEFIIGKVLNHTSKGITGQVYNRYEYLAEKKQALEQWGVYLEKLVAPAGKKVAA
jgi:integrase